MSRSSPTRSRARSGSVRPAEDAGALPEPRAWRRPADARGGPTPRVWIDGAEGSPTCTGTLRRRAHPRAGDRDLGRKRRAADARDGGGARLERPCAGTAGFRAAIRSGSRRRDRAPAGFDDARGGDRLEPALRGGERSGVGTDGRATYTGILRERLAAFSPELAGFHVGNLDEVSGAMNALRARLERAG